jgi:hypothetical protein
MKRNAYWVVVEKSEVKRLSRKPTPTAMIILK